MAAVRFDALLDGWATLVAKDGACDAGDVDNEDVCAGDGGCGLGEDVCTFVVVDLLKKADKFDEDALLEELGDELLEERFARFKEFPADNGGLARGAEVDSSSSKFALACVMSTFDPGKGGS